MSSLPLNGRISELRNTFPGANEAIVNQYGPVTRFAFQERGGNISLPVVIPAHNEEADLPATLAKLAFSEGVSVQPYVIVNACTDRTADFAEAMGATVIEESQPGKTIATQTAITELAANGHSTILFTDADSLVQRRWAKHMLGKTREMTATGGIVFGSVIFEHGGRPDMDAIRSGWVGLQNLVRRPTERGIFACGSNYGLQLDDNKEIETAIASLPNYFPGEDVAIRDAVIEAGGNVKSTLHPNAYVFSLGDRYTGGLPIVAARSVMKKLGVSVQNARYPEHEGKGFIPYEGKN